MAKKGANEAVEVDSTTLNLPIYRATYKMAITERPTILSAKQQEMARSSSIRTHVRDRKHAFHYIGTLAKT